MSESAWTTVTHKKPKKEKPHSPNPVGGGGGTAPFPSSESGSVHAPVQKKTAHAGHNKQRGPVVDPRLLDEDTGDYHVKTVGASIGRRIANARQVKGMTQKELALAIQEQLLVVQQYERGEAIPDNRIFTKMEKALGTKVRGKLD